MNYDGNDSNRGDSSSGSGSGSGSSRGNGSSTPSTPSNGTGNRASTPPRPALGSPAGPVNANPNLDALALAAAGYTAAPGVGVDPAALLASAFPTAPAPSVILRTATLRLTGRGGAGAPGYSCQIIIPKPILEAMDWGVDDTLLITAWPASPEVPGSGVVKLELAGNGD